MTKRAETADRRGGYSIFLIYPIFLIALYFLIKLAFNDPGIYGMVSSAMISSSIPTGIFLMLSVIFAVASLGYYFFRKRNDIFPGIVLRNRTGFNILCVAFTLFVSGLIFMLIYLRDMITGRYSISHFFVGDVFAYGLAYPDIRTYVSVPVSILNSFGFGVSLPDMISFNMILAFLLGTLFFIFIYAISGKALDSFFFSSAFVLSMHFIMNAVSFESITGSVLMTLASFFCMFLFLREKDQNLRYLLYVSFLSFAVATVFFRYEKSVLLFMPIALFIALNWKRFSGYRKTNAVFLVLFCILSIPVMSYYFLSGNDYSLKGERYESGTFEIITNSMRIFNENIFVKQDFRLWKYNVSVTFYLAILASVLALYLIHKTSQKETVPKKDGWRTSETAGNCDWKLTMLELFAIYWAFYILSQLSFKTESLLPVWKNLEFSFSELFLCYFLFDWVSEKLSDNTENAHRMKRIFFSGLMIFLLLISLHFSRYYYFTGKDTSNFPSDLHTGEMLLLENLDNSGEFDHSCMVLRFNDRYPLFDFMVGGFKSIDYSSINPGNTSYHPDLSGKCVYIYEGNFTDWEIASEDVVSDVGRYKKTLEGIGCNLTTKKYNFSFNQKDILIRMHKFIC